MLGLLILLPAVFSVSRLNLVSAGSWLGLSSSIWLVLAVGTAVIHQIWVALCWGLGAVLALLSVVTVFFMDIAAGLIMPVVAVAALAALLWTQWPARVPGFVHRLAFPFIALAFVYDLTSTSEPLPALIRLDLLLILYRLITYRQRRDDLQLVLLGLFLIIVAGVITVSISFALQLIAFTGCALIMLLAVTL